MTTDALQNAIELMRHASVSGVKDPGALDALQGMLEPLGFICHRVVFDGDGSYPVDNLYAKLGNEQPNLCFAGHTDVVPVGDAAAWSIDPFVPQVQDGMLIGRGAVDMKAAIGSFVAAVSGYLEDGNKPKGSISFLITGDEEADSINGTVKMLGWLKEKGEVIDACIVGEPTNPTELGEMIKIGRRGSVSFDLTVKGTQGHVAYPKLAENPITPMVDILHRMTQDALDEGTEFFQPTNLEILSVDAGNAAYNVIPASVSAKGNIRFNSLHTKQSLGQRLNEHCRAVTENYTLELHPGSECFLTPPGELSTLVANSVEVVTGKMPELSTTGGTSDARFIKDICAVVECGLINKTAHKVDEQVSVEAIEQLAEIYKKILESYFS